jgi:GAF domain-containing protein
MADKKVRGPRRSDRPRDAVAAELKEKRDAFLQTFFQRGAELTDELVKENRRLKEQLAALEQENTSLRTQLASDEAIRELLKKIAQLEREKARLLSTVHEQEEITSRVSNRFVEVESELESFANLYVASFQLHGSLRVRSVLRNVKELLGQLVGVRSLAVYFPDGQGSTLLPIGSEGVDLGTLPAIPLRESTAAGPVEGAIERAYLTGVTHIAEGDGAPAPAACVPLLLEQRIVGVIAVYALLEHKKKFVTVDRELLKLLGAHAGAAFVSAYLWHEAEGRLPSAEVLREACA